MTTTDLAKRLGALATAHREALSALATDADDKAAKLYRPSDFQRICAALVKHVEMVSA